MRGSFCPTIGAKVRGDRALVKALEQLAGGEGSMLVHEQRAWASISFAGARHSFTWAFEGAGAVEAGERMIASLPEHEFDVPRQLVADATVVRAEHRLLPEPRLEAEFELLLLEDN